jgi:hypothetical protein
MDKKIIIGIFAVLFLGSGFLLYNSYQEARKLNVQTKKLDNRAKEHEILKTQSEKQATISTPVSTTDKTKNITQQLTTSVNNTNVVKNKTTYEKDLKSRMTSANEGNVSSEIDALRNNEDANEAWTKELNKIYSLLMSELSGSQKAKLQNSQKAWIKSVEKEVNTAMDEYCPADSNGERVGCGTLGGLEEMRIRVRRTRSRTLELARMYDEMHN